MIQLNLFNHLFEFLISVLANSIDFTKLSFFRKCLPVKFIFINIFTNITIFGSNPPSRGLLLLFGDKLNSPPNLKVFIGDGSSRLLSLLLLNEGYYLLNCQIVAILDC